MAPDSIFVVIAELSIALEGEVDVIELSKYHFAEKIPRSAMPWTPNN